MVALSHAVVGLDVRGNGFKLDAVVSREGSNVLVLGKLVVCANLLDGCLPRCLDVLESLDKRGGLLVNRRKDQVGAGALVNDDEVLC